MKPDTWIEFKDSLCHRYFYGRYSSDCVIVNKRDGFITGHVSRGDLSSLVEVFKNVDDAKRWVLKENGVVTPKICPRCGYEGD